MEAMGKSDQQNDVRPYTGQQYLDSLADGREIWF